MGDEVLDDIAEQADEVLRLVDALAVMDTRTVMVLVDDTDKGELLAAALRGHERFANCSHAAFDDQLPWPGIYKPDPAWVGPLDASGHYETIITYGCDDLEVIAPTVYRAADL